MTTQRRRQQHQPQQQHHHHHHQHRVDNKENNMSGQHASRGSRVKKSASAMSYRGKQSQQHPQPQHSSNRRRKHDPFFMYAQRAPRPGPGIAKGHSNAALLANTKRSSSAHSIASGHRRQGSNSSSNGIGGGRVPRRKASIPKHTNKAAADPTTVSSQAPSSSSSSSGIDVDSASIDDLLNGELPRSYEAWQSMWKAIGKKHQQAHAEFRRAQANKNKRKDIASSGSRGKFAASAAAANNTEASQRDEYWQQFWVKVHKLRERLHKNNNHGYAAENKDQGPPLRHQRHRRRGSTKATSGGNKKSTTAKDAANATTAKATTTESTEPTPVSSAEFKSKVDRFFHEVKQREERRKNRKVRRGRYAAPAKKDEAQLMWQKMKEDLENRWRAKNLGGGEARKEEQEQQEEKLKGEKKPQQQQHQEQQKPPRTYFKNKPDINSGSSNNNDNNNNNNDNNNNNNNNNNDNNNNSSSNSQPRQPTKNKKSSRKDPFTRAGSRNRSSAKHTKPQAEQENVPKPSFVRRTRSYTYGFYSSSSRRSHRRSAHTASRQQQQQQQQQQRTSSASASSSSSSSTGAFRRSQTSTSLPVDVMSIRQLKQELVSHGVPTADCVEKEDLVRRVLEARQRRADDLKRRREQEREQRAKQKRRDQILKEVEMWSMGKNLAQLLNEVNGATATDASLHVPLRRATVSQVSRAYKRAMLKIHPDKHVNDENDQCRATEMFKVVTSKFAAFQNKKR